MERNVKYSKRILTLLLVAFMFGLLGEKLLPTPEGETITNPELNPDEKGSWEVMYMSGDVLRFKQFSTYREVKKFMKGKKLAMYRDLTRKGQIFRREKK